jgi:dephospho-CoA kinase
MPVYFSAGAPDFGGRVLLIDAPLALRVRRLLRRGMDVKRARAQANALKFGPAQRRKADEVIHNSGSMVELHRCLNHFLEKYDTSTR